MRQSLFAVRLSGIRKGTRNGIAVALLVLWSAGCTQTSQQTALPPPVVPIDFDRYRSFRVEEPLLPLRLQGAVQLNVRGERESGELTLQALPGPLYALDLRARLTGGMALQLRFDERRVMLVDHVNKTYVLRPNTAGIRRRLLEIDLSPQEFQTLLTGRITAAQFGGNHAAPPAADGALEFGVGTEYHRFRLGPDGLPREWVKVRDGHPVFRVEYRDYLSLPQAGGAPLRLPRKVRLYRLNDGQDPHPLLILGVAEAQPGVGSHENPTPDILPPGTEDFAPGELPPLPNGN